MDGTTDPGNGNGNEHPIDDPETEAATEAPEGTGETDGQLVPVAAFESGFDFNDDHCSSSPETVLEDMRGEVSPELFAELTAELQYTVASEAHTKVTDRISDVEEQIEEFDQLQDAYDEATDDPDVGTAPEPAAAPDPKVRADLERLLEVYSEAAERLTYCSDYCCCASDAYDGYGKDWLNDSFTQLGSHTWAVRHVGWPKNDPLDDITGELDIDDVFGRVNTRDGWSCCDLKWDGTDLHVRFSGYSCGTYSLLLTPLTESQEAALEAWGETDSYSTDLAARVVDADAVVLAAAVRIWQETPEADAAYDDFEALLDAVTELGADAVTDLPTAVVARLAPGWAGTKPDLLRTARDIMGLPHLTSAASFTLARVA